MAEAVGFEPTERSHVRRFSRPLQSTTLPRFPYLASVQGVEPWPSVLETDVLP